MFGKLSDVIGRRKCLFVTVLGTASPILALCLTSNLWVYAAAAAFSGEQRKQNGINASTTVPQFAKSKLRARHSSMLMVKELDIGEEDFGEAFSATNSMYLYTWLFLYTYLCEEVFLPFISHIFHVC